MTLQQKRSESVYLDSKNVRIHYDGRWRLHTIGRTVNDYLLGRWVDMMDLDGDIVNLLDIEKFVKDMEPEYKDCKFVFFVLKNGLVESLETEKVLLEYWSQTPIDRQGFIHIFAEAQYPVQPTPITASNCSIEEVPSVSSFPSQFDFTSVESQNFQPSCTPKPPHKKTSSRKTPKKRAVRNKKFNLPSDVEVLSSLPENSDDDIPEEVLDDIPSFPQTIDVESETKPDSDLFYESAPFKSPFIPTDPTHSFDPTDPFDLTHPLQFRPTKTAFVPPSSLRPTLPHLDGDENEHIMQLHRNINIDDVEPEEDFIPSSDSELDVEEYKGFATAEYGGFAAETDNLYSEEECNVQHYNIMEVGKLEQGMTWPTLEQTRIYLRTYAIKNHFAIFFHKNDKRKVWGICDTPGCPWMCRIYKLVDGHTCRLSVLQNQHTCRHTCNKKNKMANAKWVAATFEEEIKTHITSWKPKDIMIVVWKAYRVQISYDTAWSARVKVLERIYGTYEDSYKKGPEICRQINNVNPGSIATCNIDNMDGTFMGSCVAFSASLKGFVEGCRPLVGLDGCFLKGKYGGVCLSATALDGNNGLFPLAIYICKSECAETWKRFLEILKGPLLLHPKRLSFISDRQKGLVQAVADLFPDHHHRFCFRHMYKNFKTWYKGDHLKNLVWGIARAFTVEDHAKWFAHIQNDAPDAHEWLLREDVGAWSRSYFDRTSKCEHVTNNFSESFNNWIKDLRDKPLTAFIDKYSRMVMKLFYDRRSTSKKWDVNGIVPRATIQIEKLCEQMNRYTVYPSDEGLYMVESNFSPTQRWTVDTEQRSCECCVWDISGIPCVHAVCILAPDMAKWEDYVSEFHLVKTYQKTYAERVVPLPDVSKWQEPLYTVLPPILQRKPGRPRGVRKREADEEVRAPKRPRICSICKLSGHNKTTCAGGAVGSNKKATVKKGGAPKAVKNPSTLEGANVENGGAPKASKNPSTVEGRAQKDKQRTINSKKTRNLRFSVPETVPSGISGPTVKQPSSPRRRNSKSKTMPTREFEPPRRGDYVQVRPPNPNKYLEVQRPNGFSQPPPMKAPTIPTSQIFRPRY